MFDKSILKYLMIAIACSAYASCGVPRLAGGPGRQPLPARYGGQRDTANAAALSWRDYFRDPYLCALIDTALARNQELQIRLQEMEIGKAEIRARKGEYLPSVGLRAGAAVDKVGRYTLRGASEEEIDIVHGSRTPSPLRDYQLSAVASWEVDIWHKLRNAKKAAVARYLASAEGKNLVVTSLVAELADSYYELLALDRQLDIVEKNIAIQRNALEVVRLQKEATRVTELAVRRFEAEVLHTESLQYDIRQRITETENRINFLLARYPQPIPRNDSAFDDLLPGSIHAGIPSQLLANRPDIRQAEQELAAAKLDVQVARARFYPRLAIDASVGYGAFNPAYLVRLPESLIFSLAGELVAPLINRNAIKAGYYSANARQIQAVYQYQRVVLNAFTEVLNQMSNIGNLEKKYALKVKQTEALSSSIGISDDLFRAARADYMEVLLTRRDALSAKFELVETRMQQMHAVVHIYQALGGGWN